MTIEKFCTRCGKKFLAVGREVICPDCKAQAAEDAKRAAVLKAKRASWNGESVPVRISGRASTLIREYGAEEGLPFAAALDALLKASDCFKSLGMAWEDITPYKSRRRDKHATEDASTTENKQDAPQDAPQEVKQEAQEVKQEEVKQTAKASTSTSKATTSKATSKTSTAKKAVKTAAGKAGKKA